MLTWNKTLDVRDLFHNDKLSFVEKRDKIVRRIVSSKFYNPLDFALTDVVALLADAEDAEEFEGVWDEFYAWADAHRVWVSTF